MTRPDTRILRSAPTSRPIRQGRPTASPCATDKRLRQRRAGRDQPAAEVGAGRAGARVLDDRAVLREEEPHDHRAARRSRRADRRPARRHTPWRAGRCGRARAEDRLAARRGEPHRRRRAESRAAPTPVSTQSGGAAGSGATSASANASIAASSARGAATGRVSRRIGLQRPRVAARIDGDDARDHLQRHAIAGILSARARRARCRASDDRRTASRTPA